MFSTYLGKIMCCWNKGLLFLPLLSFPRCGFLSPFSPKVRWETGRPVIAPLPSYNTQTRILGSGAECTLLSQGLEELIHRLSSGFFKKSQIIQAALLKFVVCLLINHTKQVEETVSLCCFTSCCSIANLTYCNWYLLADFWLGEANS